MKDGAPLAYLVTEYAEENLAKVLAERALNSDEVLAMLPPIADAMAFLHDRGYALGNLKPSHIFAVQDIVKVSSDAVDAGDTSADLHALAATVTQALTGKPIAGTTEGAAGVMETLPEPIREITRGCLGSDGRAPWSAAELASRLRGETGPDLAPSETATQDSRSTAAKPKLPRPGHRRCADRSGGDRHWQSAENEAGSGRASHFSTGARVQRESG